MQIGNTVKISIYTTDPLKRQGQVGKIIRIKTIDEDESEVTVRFADGTEGVYYDNCLIKINE